MARRYPLPWSERLTDLAQASSLNAAAFMAFVAAGCAYIILAKLAGIGQFYVTFAPVGMMLGYALLIYLAKGLRLRDDQSGDNLYYMGFLFTLTSLGVSLYQFAAERAAEEIVQNFGIAIASTIAGIGLRVMFNQMRRDPIEVERMMRLELAEAARRVRRELDSTVVEFRHYRRGAEQAAADSFGHITEKFDEIAGKFLAKLEDIAVKLAGPIEAASRRSADAIDEATRTAGTKLSESASMLSAASEALLQRAQAISAEIDAVAAKLGAIEAPERLIEIRLEPVAQSLTQAADRLAAQAERQASVIADTVAAANAATAQSIELVMALRREFDTGASMNRTSLDAATNMIQAMTEVLNEFKTNSKTYVDVLGFMLDKTDATMRTFTDVLIRSGVEATTQTHGLREVLPAIEASMQTLAAAGERMSGLAKDLRPARRVPKREKIE
jgi:hypothetical protein